MSETSRQTNSGGEMLVSFPLLFLLVLLADVDCGACHTCLAAVQEILAVPPGTNNRAARILLNACGLGNLAHRHLSHLQDRHFSL